ncbi:MAG: DUF4276 family protein [Candidatus Omnitrophota bacterium]|jgi:hypothetical protein|nr:MAG: DUF4276 family protein [Candidatus Omnitrophota bacterium]
MSSIHIYIIVEGQTEQTFVRDVLAPQIAHKKIYLYPALIGKPGHKGGDIRFERARSDIEKFLKQRGDAYISTMFDYYRINGNWPGRANVHQQMQKGTMLTAVQKAKILETATLNEIVHAFPNRDADKRFIPYIQMHEFEALLFSDPVILATTIGIDQLQIIGLLHGYGNPEEINDDPVKAPSKRLTALKDGYRKVAMGKILAESIGIQKIRMQCPHFNCWLTQLENLTVIN